MMCRISSLLVIVVMAVVGSVVTATPAAATTKNSCGSRVCLTIVYSGTKVSKATVSVPGLGEGTVVRLYYRNYYREHTQHCLPCAYQFAVNQSYAHGDRVYGGAWLSSTFLGEASVVIP